MNKFVKGALAAAFATVASVVQLGCVAAVDDETADLQEASAEEEIGEAKAAAAACAVNDYKVRWDPAGVYSIPNQDPNFLIKKKKFDNDVTGPRGARGLPSAFNSHKWTRVNVNGGYANGYMRDDALRLVGCH